MNIRLAQPADLPVIMDMFAHARRIMQDNGNPNQWTDGYPSAELMAQEIASGHCRLCEDGEGVPVGTFCFITGEDPTYARIDDGEWLNDLPYAVIHRMATNGRCPGVSEACLNWCGRQCDNLRADTHHDNHIMQHILERHGFRRCGIIYVRNGSPRIAYQRTIESAL